MADSNNKLAVMTRYAGQYAAGGLTVFVALGTLTPDQQTQILSSTHTMYTATQAFVGAAANIWYIVFPILAIYLTKLGINSTDIGAMMDRIFKAAKAGNVDAKVAIVNAAASPEIGSQAVVNKEMASNPATSVNVVAAPADVPAKKT